MITKMNKYSFLVYHKDYECFLKNLQQMGVVHIEHNQVKENHPLLEQLSQQQKKIEEQLSLLENIKTEYKDQSAEEGESLLSSNEKENLIDSIDSLNEEINKAQAMIQALEKEMDQLSIWGPFSYETLNRLNASGYKITFFICPSSHYSEQWEKDYNACLINTVGINDYFITITKVGEEVAIDAEIAKLPNQDITQLHSAMEEENRKKIIAEKKLLAIATFHIQEIKYHQTDNINELTWQKALFNTQKTNTEKLMLLEGYIPQEKAPKMEEELNQNKYYYLQMKITPEDNVPIQLKNNFFSRLFEPIGALYMLPKYNELDLTPFFAPFFMIFFGLCLGDSGYGLFLLLIATAAKVFYKKASKSMKSIFSLIQVFGISTFLCGLLTGTFFGTNLYDWGIPGFDKLKDIIQLSDSQMFTLAIVMGVIQILFGMILKTINRMIQFGFAYGLSMIGWILLIISSFFAFLFPQIMPIFGTIHIIIVSICGILIFLLNSPGKNPLLNIGLGLWDTYNMATGFLGDVLSYIRLFALGLAGGILASVFNNLAVGLSPDNAIIGPIVMVLIFIVGHAINIFMNVLGALVHPMRLTFVEFFKNAGFNGGGEKYSPFIKQQKTIVNK